MQRPRRAAARTHSAVATAQTDGTAPGVYTAAISGDFEYLLQLLDAGAPTDTYTQGWTPLHAACANGHEKVAAALVAAGADATARSKDDEMLNPAELAEVHGHRSCAQLVKRQAKRQAVRRTAANSPQRTKRLDRQRAYANRLSSPVRPRMHPPASQIEVDLDKQQPLPRRQSSRPKLRPRGSRRVSAHSGEPDVIDQQQDKTNLGGQYPADGDAPTSLSAGLGKLTAAPVQQRSNSSAPPAASNRAAKLREMSSHGELNVSKDELGSFGVAQRFGRGGIYPERLSSPLASPGVGRSASRSRSASPSRRRSTDDAHGDDMRAGDSARLPRELGTSRDVRTALDGELRVTQIALRKSQKERVAWQERALAAEQALRELQTFAEERSQLGSDAAQPADTELAELHQLIAHQAETIDKLARIAELPLDSQEHDGNVRDEDKGMDEDDAQHLRAAPGAVAGPSDLPRPAWPEDDIFDPPDDSME
jgi:hypothetical protein|eukprot:COSAG02_NODE_3169_length_7237_cov_11.752592_4_plen_480_part_00